MPDEYGVYNDFERFLIGQNKKIEELIEAIHREENPIESSSEAEFLKNKIAEAVEVREDYERQAGGLIEGLQVYQEYDENLKNLNAYIDRLKIREAQREEIYAETARRKEDSRRFRGHILTSQDYIESFINLLNRKRAQLGWLGNEKLNFNATMEHNSTAQLIEKFNNLLSGSEKKSENFNRKLSQIIEMTYRMLNNINNKDLNKIIANPQSFKIYMDNYNQLLKTLDNINEDTIDENFKSISQIVNNFEKLSKELAQNPLSNNLGNKNELRMQNLHAHYNNRTHQNVSEPVTLFFKPTDTKTKKEIELYKFKADKIFGNPTFGIPANQKDQNTLLEILTDMYHDARKQQAIQGSGPSWKSWGGGAWFMNKERKNQLLTLSQLVYNYNQSPNDNNYNTLRTFLIETSAKIESTEKDKGRESALKNMCDVFLIKLGNIHPTQKVAQEIEPEIPPESPQSTPVKRKR